MTMIKEKRISFEIDEEGFLVDTDDWNEETARILARQEGIDDLTDEKLAIVKFLRDYYYKFEAFPILNERRHHIVLFVKAILTQRALLSHPF